MAREKAAEEKPPVGFAEKVQSMALFLYHRARADIAGIWQAGWRPALGFTGVYIAHFAYVVAPSKGIAIDYTAVNLFLGMVFLQALGRGFEKVIANRTPAAG